MTREIRRILQQGFLKMSAWLEPPIWEGLYPRRSDVPTKGPGFSGPSSVRESLAALQNLRRDASHFLPQEVPAEHLLLPFFVSVLAQTQDHICVLDFGGGFGLFYQQILNCVIDHPRLDYHILEVPFVCSAAAKEWTDHPRIHFHPDQPALSAAVDVLFINSALQYTDNYKEVLKSLCKSHRPRYVLLAKLSAVETPTYASAQKNVNGSVIPYWFINVQEILPILREQHYRLVYKSTLEKDYRQTGFPPSHRMRKASNLLFVREA